MSTALLDETTDTVLEEPQELVLDAVTRQRLEVAACAVDTLEELADSGAWERLDEALAEHLVQHALRLCGFLERVRHLPSVKACEQEMLAIRRVERRLEVALDLLLEDERETTESLPGGKPKRGKGGGDANFLGDFTEASLTADEREQVRERRLERKAAKRLLSPGAKRIVAYMAACFVLVISSAVLVSLGVLQGQPESATAPPPREPMKVNKYLQDVRVFLPAKLVMVQGNTAVVMVEREWLLKTPSERQVDADGAHVYLSNRNITALELLWVDGGLIARATKEGHAVFAEGTSGLIGRRNMGADDSAPAVLGPPPPPGL